LGGGVNKYCIFAIILSFLFLSSCNHQKNTNEQNHNKKARLKTFTIKTKDASSGEVLFQNESITLNKKDIEISFYEADAPTEFICSKNFPITIELGKEENLKFSIAPSAGYSLWEREVRIKCTKSQNKLKNANLKIFTIKGKDASTGKVLFQNESITLNKKDIEISFHEADAPTEFICSKNFPITIELGKEENLKFSIAPSAGYSLWEREVRIKCVKLQELKLSLLKVHGIDVKDDGSVNLSEKFQKVEKENVTIQFEQSNVPAPSFEGLPINLKAGEEYTFKISTSETETYTKWEKTVTIKCLNLPHIKKLTIAGISASSGKVTIPTDRDKVEKTDVHLEFVESDAPTEFNFASEPKTMPNPKDKAIITLSTAETANYGSWSFEIEVTRAKENSETKTIDDCVEALRGQLPWSGAVIEEDISFPSEVLGFAGSVVKWTCEDEHCDSNGKITKELNDVKVIIKALVKWNGDERTVTFTTTIRRIMKIREIKQGKTASDPTTTHTIDFSNKNIWVYSINDKPQLEVNIKNLDSNKKEIIANTRRGLYENELLSMEESLDAKKRFIDEKVTRILCDKYFELINKNEITWEEIKSYVLNAKLGGLTTSSTDEQIYKEVSEYKNNAPSFEDFKKMSKEEKTKLIKGYLTNFTTSLSLQAIIDSDKIGERELVETLKSRLYKIYSVQIKHNFREWKYRYKIEAKPLDTNFPDGYSFTAVGLYDKSKSWYDQRGCYKAKDPYGAKYTLIAKADNSEMYIVQRKGDDEPADGGLPSDCLGLSPLGLSFSIVPHGMPVTVSECEIAFENEKGESLNEGQIMFIRKVAGLWSVWVYEGGIMEFLGDSIFNNSIVFYDYIKSKIVLRG